MIQADGQNDAMRAAALPPNIRLAFVPPPFEAEMSCNGGAHTVTVVEGIPLRSPHDSEDERALRILGGDHLSCAFLRESILGALGGPQPRSTSQGGAVEPLWVRLYGLANMRASVVAQAWLSSEQEISRYARAQLNANRRLHDGVRVVVGDGPALRPRKNATTIVLARDWFATVFLWGLDQRPGYLVAGLRRDDDGVIVSRVSEFAPGAIEEERVELDGIRLIT